MNIKIKQEARSFNDAVGVSDERNLEIGAQMERIADEVFSSNEWVPGDIFKKFLAVAATDAEAVLCALSAGGFIKDLEAQSVSENNPLFAVMAAISRR